MQTTHENQSFLFAKNEFGPGQVLGYIGDPIGHGFKDYSSFVQDNLDGYDEELEALTNGFYVWEGSLWVETGDWAGSEPIDADFSFDGKIRPAVFEDFEKYGLPIKLKDQ